MSSTEKEWKGSTISMTNRYSTSLEYSNHSNLTTNDNSTESGTSSSLRSSRFPQIDTDYNYRQQLSPTFQRLSSRSKELYKSYDFAFPALTVGSANNRDNDTEFPFDEVHKKNHSTFDLATQCHERSHGISTNFQALRNPLSKPLSIGTKYSHETDTMPYSEKESTKSVATNEWASTSVVLGEEDLLSSDEEATMINSITRNDYSVSETKRLFDSETFSDISFGQSTRTPAGQAKSRPNDRYHFTDSASLSTPISIVDTNRDRISLQRTDAAPTLSNAKKAQELEALKKRSKVTSMCKSFEHKIGGNSEIPSLPSRSHLSPFVCRMQVSTESAPQPLPRLTAVAENDRNVIEVIDKNGDETNTFVVKDSTVTAVETEESESEEHHQAIVNNIITVSLSPISHNNVKNNGNVRNAMKWKSTVFPANITAAMCVTKDESNNNDKVPENNKQNNKLPLDKNGKMPNGTTAANGTAAANRNGIANGTVVAKGVTANGSAVNGVPPKSPVTHDSASDNGIPLLKLRGFVGFDSLPYQLVKKCHNDGFQFNLLCVGETGMGKTTLIESLFNRKMDFEPCNSELKTVELRTKYCEVEESNVRVKLRVVETAGFGDQLDKDKSAKVIVDYINEQFEAYLREELKITRFLSGYDDTRIHACLYFISPTGHGLKALDVVTMRELSKRANVIPVIAKSDTACKDELIRFKQKIMNELKANNIEVYQFPVDDEAVRKENAALNALLPFAVVGSCDFVAKEDGRLVRARNYVWGRVEVENEEHCDFVKLREALLRINEDSLRERTHTVLYEAYRRQRLQEMRMADGDAGPRMVEATLKRKKEFEAEVRRRDEQFKLEFESRVQRKEADMKHREDGLHHRQRNIDEKFHRESQDLDNEITRVKTEIARLLAAGGKKQRK